MAGEESNTLESQIASFDPSSPEALAALEKAVTLNVGEIQENGEAEKQDDNKAEANPSEDPAATESAASSTQTDKPKGVQAKDGEHIIPYSVLERERERALRAEATAQALAEQLERLQKGEMPAQAKSEDQAELLTPEDLEMLDQDLPGVAKAIRAQMAMIENLKENLKNIQREQEVQQETRKQSIQDEIEAAIQADPNLSAWREAAARQENPDPKNWNRAVEIDRILREDPDWQDKTIAERFSHVTKVMNATYGVPIVSSTPQQKTQKPTAKQVADAAIQSAREPIPETLSEIPGGVPPAQSDLDTLQNASVVALGNKFMSMTPEQIESYLSRMAV
jgi:hypothetical protein